MVETADQNAEKVTFSFGKNWQDFTRSHLTPQGHDLATESLIHFLNVENLSGLTFLDIGCGSGLFSHAACRLGARAILSVDVDPYSVASTVKLREAAGSPDHWKVLHGSILDADFVATLPPSDIVYAWGSLHHTGSMWQAIRNASRLVAPGGVFFLAIYNRVEGRGSSEYWLRMKKLYNRSSVPAKRLMEIAYAVRYQVIPDLLRLKNPLASIRNYKTRGMNFWIDVRDWLGGYPYEAARADEIFRFVSRELGFTLVNLHTVNDTGCSEYLFQRPLN